MSDVVGRPVDAAGVVGAMGALGLSDEDDIRARAEAAIEVLARAMRDHAVILSVSLGKDSFLLLCLACCAYEAARDRGWNPCPLFVGNSTTGVENPAMDAYVEEAFHEIEANAAARGIDIRVLRYRPTLAAGFVARVIGQGFRPVYPGTEDRWCSIDWKVRPGKRAQAKMIPELEGELRDKRMTDLTEEERRSVDAQLFRLSDGRPPVVVLGTRKDESARRAAGMEERRESAHEVAVMEDGTWTLAPLADWSTFDVLQWYAYADPGAAGGLRACMDTRPLLDIYRDANEGTCTLLPGQDTRRSACGARTGCFTCCAVEDDKSLQAMVNDDKYAHLRGLLAFRNHLSAIEHDFSTRRPFARTVEGDSIRVFPDSLSAGTVKLMLRALLTLQLRERRRADGFAAALARGDLPDDAHLQRLAAAGRTDEAYKARMAKPQFEPVTVQDLMLVEAYWALYGISVELFEACAIYREVMVDGVETDLPEVERTPAGPAPKVRFIDLGPVSSDPSWGLTCPMTEWMEWAGTDSHIGRLAPADVDSIEVDEDKAREFVFEVVPWLTRAGSTQRNMNPFLPLEGLGRMIRAGIIRMPSFLLTEWKRMAVRSQKLRNAGLYGTPDLAGVPLHAVPPARAVVAETIPPEKKQLPLFA